MKIFLLFIAINICMGWLHNFLRVRAIKQGRTNAIDHTFWSVWYGILCGPFAFVSIPLAFSIAVLHASVFPAALNYFAKIKIFNLSVTTTSKYDQTIKKINVWIEKKTGRSIPNSYGMLPASVFFFSISIFLLWL